jgi:hypothetical protein
LFLLIKDPVPSDKGAAARLFGVCHAHFDVHAGDKALHVGRGDAGE